MKESDLESQQPLPPHKQQQQQQHFHHHLHHHDAGVSDSILEDRFLQSPTPDSLKKDDRNRLIRFMLTNSNCLVTVIFVLFLILSSIMFRDYIHSVLRWIESQPDALVFIILVILYTIVSLPIAWGYIIINIATGYLYGIVNGILVTLVTATLGIFIAHHIMKRFLVQYIQRILQTNPSQAGSTLRSLNLLLASPSHAFKLVALSRLTPIPFGLQNSVFAVSSLSTFKYLQATCLGLLPCQIINAYLGSTLRSMEEVLDDSQSATVAIVALVFQVIVAIVLVAFVVRKAREELDRAVETNLADSYSTTSSDKKDKDPFEVIFMDNDGGNVNNVVIGSSNNSGSNSSNNNNL